MTTLIGNGGRKVKTIEEVAREAAERLITVEKYEPEDGTYWVCIGRCPTQSGDAHLYHNPIDAEHDCRLYRENSVPIIAAAIEEYCRQGVTSPGMTDERLKEIEAWASEALSPSYECFAELIEEVYFLRRLMADDLDRGVAKELDQARAECARLKESLRYLNRPDLT